MTASDDASACDAASSLPPRVLEPAKNGVTDDEQEG